VKNFLFLEKFEISEKISCFLKNLKFLKKFLENDWPKFLKIRKKNFSKILGHVLSLIGLGFWHFKEKRNINWINSGPLTPQTLKKAIFCKSEENRMRLKKPFPLNTSNKTKKKRHIFFGKLFQENTEFGKKIIFYKITENFRNKFGNFEGNTKLFEKFYFF